MLNDKKNYGYGMACAVGCMIIWGVLPIYWKSLIPISSSIIIMYRIVLAWVACLIGGIKVYGVSELTAPLKNKKTATELFLAGIMITTNWSTFIYAINSGQAIQTSIGYYIQPLIICVFGVVFFGERPTKYRLIAISFAAAGVIMVLLHFMRVPLIALTLAVTFSTYTAIKRHLKLKVLIALFCETIFLIPVVLGMIIYFEVTGTGALATGQPYQIALLSLSGLATAVPLAMFAAAANRVNMIPLGIIAYIGPSITLVIGIFVFREPFDIVQFFSFVVIWIGLMFFTYGEIRTYNQGGKINAENK